MRTAAIIILAAALPPGTVPDLPAVPVETMEPAVRAQFEETIARVKGSPDDADANGALGMLCHAYELHVLAVPCYERAMELAPGDPLWPFYLGVVLQELGAWERSAAVLGPLAAADSRDGAAILSLGHALRRTNRLEEALAAYRRAIELDPARPQAHCGAGQVSARMGDDEGALPPLREALRLEPRYGAAHYSLGQCLRKLGRMEEAREALKLAELYRDDEPAVNDPRLAALTDLATGAVAALNRGIDLLHEGQYEQAIVLLEEAARLAPALAEAHSQLGTAHLAAGRLEIARAHLERALSIDPWFVDAIYNLGLVAHRQGRHGDAVALFERAVSIRPSHFDAHLGLGADLPAAGRGEDAERHLREAMSLRPDDPRPYKRLAALLSAASKDAEAAAVLRRGASRLPGDASIADRLAWILATSSDPAVADPAEALRIAEEVCRVTRGEVPQALATRAAALAALGRRDEGIESARRALELARAAGNRDLAAEIEAQLRGYQK